MFDIAWSELLVIAIVALIFIGPKELPAVLNSLGRTLSKLRRSADDFRRQFEDSMREAGYEDLHKNLQDIRQLNPANQLRSTIENAISQDYTPKPAASGSPELPSAHQPAEAHVEPAKEPAAAPAAVPNGAAAEPNGAMREDAQQQAQAPQHGARDDRALPAA